MKAALIWDLHLTLQKMRMNFCASTEPWLQAGMETSASGAELPVLSSQWVSLPPSHSSPHFNQPGESDLRGTLISLSGRQEGKPAEPEVSELRLRNAPHFSSSFTTFPTGRLKGNGKSRNERRDWLDRVWKNLP